MPRTIEVLPDLVANQIAAGEVVERPASVVKELIENALDARATRIDIDIERGGKGRIRVTDDGIGMGREDALFSLDRHATSKIRRAKDLQSVGTFGFRGEALPSIAAVSRMTIETRGASDQVGTRVRVKGGTITAVEDVPRRRGTTVEVSNLFFNAPARSKFLKAVGAEARAVSNVVSVLALANASVGFGLTSGGRILLELPPAADLSARVAALWGREAAITLIALSTEPNGIQVRGLIQRPDAAKSGFRRAHLFVNGRPFRSRPLLAAVDRGYRTTIPERVRPWAFLYLRMPPGTVDMNVHPAKAEVRFRDTVAVESMVEEAVRTGLTSEASAATLDSQLESPRFMVREPSPQRPDESDVESQTALFLSAEAAVEPIPVVEERPRLWQILNTYVLAETREGLIIIDQHSAHERILFEHLSRALRGERADRPKAPLPAHHSPLQGRVRAGGGPHRHPQPCGLRDRGLRRQHDHRPGRS